MPALFEQWTPLVLGAAKISSEQRVLDVASGTGILARAAERLPFPERSFEAVVSQFGLIFLSRPAAALAEMLRVLVPGGRLAVAVWDSLERMPAFADEAALLDRLAGVPAGNALRAPFALGNPTALRKLPQAARLGAAQIATYTGTARLPSIRAWVEADLRGRPPVAGVSLAEPKIQQILDAAQSALDTRAAFAVSAHILSGVKS